MARRCDLGPSPTLAMGKVAMLLKQISTVEKSKTEIVQQLANAIAKSEFIFIVITRRNIIQRLLSGQNSGINRRYAVSIFDSRSVKSEIVHILSHARWHKPVTRFLVLRPGSEELLSRELANNSELEFFESKIKDEIVFFIDPVDDDLEFYGTESNREFADQFID